MELKIVAERSIMDKLRKKAKRLSSSGPSGSGEEPGESSG